MAERAGKEFAFGGAKFEGVVEEIGEGALVSFARPGGS